jgi:hypothetical protein
MSSSPHTPTWATASYYDDAEEEEKSGSCYLPFFPPNRQPQQRPPSAPAPASARPPSPVQQASSMASMDQDGEAAAMAKAPLFQFGDLLQFYDQATKPDDSLDLMRRSIGSSPTLPSTTDWKLLANLWYGMAVRLENRAVLIAMERDDVTSHRLAIEQSTESYQEELEKRLEDTKNALEVNQAALQKELLQLQEMFQALQKEHEFHLRLNHQSTPSSASSTSSPSWIQPDPMGPD